MFDGNGLMQRGLAFVTILADGRFQAALQNPEDPNHGWATEVAGELQAAVPYVERRLVEATERFGSTSFAPDMATLSGMMMQALMNG